MNWRTLLRQKLTGKSRPVLVAAAFIILCLMWLYNVQWFHSLASQILQNQREIRAAVKERDIEIEMLKQNDKVQQEVLRGHRQILDLLIQHDEATRAKLWTLPKERTKK